MALIADYLDRMIVNTILVAVDGSPASVQAARMAVGFAHDHVSKVVVLVFSNCEEGDSARTSSRCDEARDSAHLIGEYALNARIPCEMNVLRCERPAEEIAAEATRRHCDLIWLAAPAETSDVPCFLDADVAVEVLGRVDVPVMLFRSRTPA